LGCGSLTNVIIGSGVTHIDGSAFANCFALLAISVASNNPTYSSVDGVLFDFNKTAIIQFPSGFVGSFTIPDTVTSIGNSTFLWCANLTGITIPNSVTSIGNSAFLDCSSLRSVAIPDSVVTIQAFAFYGCASLTNVIIGSGVTNIGNEAFIFCSTLTHVTIGKSVKSIGNWPFRNAPI